MSEKEKFASSNPKDRNKPLEEIYKESMEEDQLQQERRVEIASKWMEGSGPDADIVISSRIRLARNVRKLPFPPLASDEQREKVLRLAEKVMENQGDANMRLQLLSIRSRPQIFRQVLVEKHLISPLLAKESRFSALMLRDDEAISIMVNEEDHFRIQ